MIHSELDSEKYRSALAAMLCHDFSLATRHVFIHTNASNEHSPTGLLKMALKNHWNEALKNKSCVSLRKTVILRKTKLSLNNNPCEKAKGEFFYFSIMKMILAKFLNSLDFFVTFLFQDKKVKYNYKNEN
jgi:hypothetical protein